MDITSYLTTQRAALTKEFEALRSANAQAKQQIASLESSIVTRSEKMANLQGAFAQLTHLEAAMTKTPEVVGTDAPLLAAVAPRKARGRKAVTQETAHG